jgi:hypothetical protein
MLITIAVVLVVALGALAAYVASRPTDFRISRSRRLGAPPHVVYGFANDLHTWREWSPWEKVDPELRREHSGAPAGVGASYYWSGNNKVGEGRMTITESVPSRRIGLRLEFLRPFAATNAAQFDFAPSGDGTTVTWTMTGRYNFVTKAIGLFVDMDRMVGGDFEKGLASLDAMTARASPTAEASRALR